MHSKINVDKNNIETIDLEIKGAKDGSNVTFGWKNVSYSVSTKAGKKQILDNVSGFVTSGNIRGPSESLMTGQMLAVLGPSGCGKSTLLNILSRRLKTPTVEGEQMLNNAPIDDATLRSMSTYVEQEDHLIGSLTVTETIGFAAKLSLPASVSPEERSKRTTDMMRDFGLKSVKDSIIGTPLKRGISGGQKRRVTTASQLITLPKVIFLGNGTRCASNRR